MGTLEGIMAAPVRRKRLQKDLGGRIRGSGGCEEWERGVGGTPSTAEFGVPGSTARRTPAGRAQAGQWDPPVSAGALGGRGGAEGQRPGWSSGPV